MLQSRARRCAACVVEYRWLHIYCQQLLASGYSPYSGPSLLCITVQGLSRFGNLTVADNLVRVSYPSSGFLGTTFNVTTVLSAAQRVGLVYKPTQLLCARNDCGKHALLAIGGCRLPLSMAVSHRCWGHWLSRAVLPQPHVVARRRPAARHSVCVVQFAAAEFRRFFNGI